MPGQARAIPPKGHTQSVGTPDSGEEGGCLAGEVLAAGPSRLTTGEENGVRFLGRYGHSGIVIGDREKSPGPRGGKES
jgi:hypothetical protein